MDNRSPEQENIKRNIASHGNSTNFTLSLKKINDLQKTETKFEKDKEQSSANYQKINEDLNFLKSYYFFENNAPDVMASFPRKNQEILLRISQNIEFYNEILNFKIQDSLLANDNKLTTQLLALAASLPLGPSPIHYLSEKILIDLTTTDRKWDEDLFRNALQFYYIQNLIKNEKNDSLLINFSEKCPNEELKKKILAIDKEINIYSKNKEDEQ